MMIEKELKKIISDDECNVHIRDTHWIPEIIILFKSYARLLVPERQSSKWDDVDFGPEGPDDAAVNAIHEDEIFCTGWNKCREEMVRRIEEIK